MTNALTFLVNGPEDMIIDYGNVSGNVEIKFTSGMTHKLILTGNVAITTSNSMSTALNEAILEIKNGGNHAITWPTNLKWINAGGVLVNNLSDIDVVFNNDGTSDFVLVWTVDGGTTLFGKVLR